MIPVLLAPEGAGKSRTLRHFAELVLEEKFPEFPPTKTDVFRISLSGVHDQNAGDLLLWHRFRRDIDNAVSTGKGVILIIDSFDRLKESGAGGLMSQILGTIMDRWRRHSHINIIGATTPELFDRHIKKRGRALAKHCRRVELPPLSDSDVEKIARGHAERYTQNGVRFSEAFLQAALERSRQKPITLLAAPGGVLHLMEAAAGIVKLFRNDAMGRGMTFHANDVTVVTPDFIDRAAAEVIQGVIGEGAEEAQAPQGPYTGEAPNVIIGEGEQVISESWNPDQRTIRIGRRAERAVPSRSRRRKKPA